MKILRTIVNGITVYMADEIEGKAEMSLQSFKAYIEALDTIALFEQEVDRQYENAKS